MIPKQGSVKKWMSLPERDQREVWEIYIYDLCKNSNQAREKEEGDFRSTED